MVKSKKKKFVIFHIRENIGNKFISLGVGFNHGVEIYFINITTGEAGATTVQGHSALCQLRLCTCLHAVFCVHLYIFMCVYMDVCVHVYIFMCVYMYVCVHVYIFMCVYVCVHVCIDMFAQMCFCVHVYIFMCVYMYVCSLYSKKENIVKVQSPST